MNNQFNNIIRNIKIIQNISYISASIKVISTLWNNSNVTGHSSRMCLTDRILSQTHVTFCEYLVFHEFRRNLLNTLSTNTMNLDVTCILLLLITLNKKVSQIYLFRFFIHSLLEYWSNLMRRKYDISDMFFIALCLAYLFDISFQ